MCELDDQNSLPPTQKTFSIVQKKFVKFCWILRFCF